MNSLQKICKKAKYVDTAGSINQDSQVCIIHYQGSRNLFFTSILAGRNPKDRFEMLKTIRDRRLSQSHDSPLRMEEMCKLIPKEITNVHGYHRDCYQMFTKNLDRLAVASGNPIVPSTSRLTRSSSDKSLFKSECIFCKKSGPKSVKKRGTWTNEFTSVFQSDSWQISYLFF